MKFPKAAAAVLAALCVVAAGVAAAVSFSNAWANGNGNGSAARCNDHGWASTASGQPAALPHSLSRSFYVWRDGQKWRLRVRGATESAPLKAQVLANAALHIARSSGARASLLSRSRKLVVRATNQFAGVDFTAACVTRLAFKLGASTPRIFLGGSGRAPAPAFRLDRPASTGVAGRILLMSACPVGGRPCPPPKPIKGTVRIETLAGKGGGGGRVVARVSSDESGSFSAEIPSGRYQLIAEKSGGYPVPKPTFATVEGGVMTLANVYLDSGIR